MTLLLLKTKWEPPVRVRLWEALKGLASYFYPLLGSHVVTGPCRLGGLLVA